MGGPRVLLGNELASFVEGLYETMFVGDSMEVIFKGLRRIMVSIIGPYSCRLLRMCSAKADWGLMCLM